MTRTKRPLRAALLLSVLLPLSTAGCGRQPSPVATEVPAPTPMETPVPAPTETPAPAPTEAPAPTQTYLLPKEGVYWTVEYQGEEYLGDVYTDPGCTQVYEGGARPDELTIYIPAKG